MKPTALPVRLEGIPSELKGMNAWVMWSYRERNGNWTKVPRMIDGKNASSTDATTWTSYADVVDTLIMDNGFDGIGLMLGADVQGIDLDDCRDLATGALSEFAEEVLARVDGYAETSPSGTGIKIFTRSNLDGGRTKKELGLELYKDGRYFTVTGHGINGHDSLPKSVQDLGWLIERVWGEGMAAASPDGAVGDLATYRPTLDGWDLDRVIDQVLPHLDPDCGYGEWLKVGAALHHQGEGDPDWLAAWDSWSEGSGKYTEGLCEQKWDSFRQQRTSGKGAVTLASLLKDTKDKRTLAVRGERDQAMDSIMAQIDAATDARDLQEKVAASVANNGDFSDVDRARVATAIQRQAKALGVSLEIGTVRGWLRARVRASFPHLNDDGHPLCTLENLSVLLGRLSVIVRYNVISKGVEILIPDSSFTRDNRDNAAIAYILSECEKARMATKFVPQFLLMLADSNLYNPVANWVQSRGWDGVSRLAAFYDTVDCGGQMDQGLKEKLMRKWLMQAIGAAFEPDGIAAQGILTFSGPQNIGKTTWFKKLAPESLNVIHTGHTLDVRSKDSCLVVLKFWIVELGEIDATFKKSDVSALKSFVTQALDYIRRPYAMTESVYGRRTVFGASVNDELFLADPTGNRRFWTIPAVAFRTFDDLDMQQVWAEVLTLWQSGERWYLSMDEAGDLGQHNDQFTAVDPVEERIASGFGWGDHVVVWDWITATEALIRIGIKDPTKPQTIMASRVLQRLNAGQRRKSNGRVLFSVPNVANDFLL
jgi:hypothetical protein